MKTCFECGSTLNIVEHHVVPRSRGGKKTVSLCQPHHDMVHGHKNPRNISVSELTREGLKKAKARGVQLGCPNPQRSIKLAHESVQKRKKDFYKQIYPKIISLRPLSNNKIADTLNKENVLGPLGGKWTATAIKRVLHQSYDPHPAIKGEVSTG